MFEVTVTFFQVCYVCELGDGQNFLNPLSFYCRLINHK